MEKSIGLLELKSIPVGIKAADEMLKAADVKLLVASPTCPGKYFIIISGNVAAVKSAMSTGHREAGSFLVSEHIINNVHPSLPGAILGVADAGRVACVGVIETISALTAVRAGDIAAKASNIALMEIRIARGLGGKGFVMFTGEVSAVKSAVQACINGLATTGDITSHTVLPSPHADLIRHLTA